MDSLANSFCQSSWPSASRAAQVSRFWLWILPTSTSCLTRSREVSLISSSSRLTSGRLSGALMAKGDTLIQILSRLSWVPLSRLSL
ncbi:hypothetical protein FQZ97_1018190 [compost metagenome]